MASRSAWPRYYRYCSLCTSRDREQVRETYWHRAHHLPGIEACHLHGVLLQDSSIPFRHDRNRHAYRTAETNIPVKCPATLPITAVQDFLARSSVWLLNHSDFSVSAEGLRKCYQSRLADLGYATRSGRIHLEKVEQDLRESMIQTGSRALVATSHMEHRAGSRTWSAFGRAHATQFAT